MNAKYYIAAVLILVIAVCGFLLGKCAYEKTTSQSVRLVHDTLRIQDTIPAFVYVPKTIVNTNEVFVYAPDTSKNGLIDSLRNAVRNALGAENLVLYRDLDTLGMELQTWVDVKNERFYDDIRLISTDTTRTETTNISTGHGWITDALIATFGIAIGTVFSIFFLR